MPRSTRIKETRPCPLHGDVTHARAQHGLRADGTTLSAWKCMVCDNERARVRAWNRRRDLKADTRPGGVRPMAPLLPGAVRPANQTLPPEALSA